MRHAAMGLVAMALSACAHAPAPEAPPPPTWSIVIHGGAGVIDRARMDAATDGAYRASLAGALASGAAMLEAGAPALDTVEAVIRALEDDPLFNAGRGAVFSAAGRNELDASIMDGRTRAAGAAAGITRTRHPISLARAVMERSEHVMLSGEGAEEFARAQGLEEVDPSYFFTERRWRALEEKLTELGLPAPPRPPGAPGAESAAPLDDHGFGTVGVAAMDRAGNLAAGTSTGGTTAKHWGRIGDSPVIGAGTYAHNGVCAVSSTGTGEYFIRLSVAHAVCARIAIADEDAQHAADAVIQNELTSIGGDGGVIVIDGAGRIAWSFNTSGMYRASAQAGAQSVVRIYADEDALPSSP